MHRYRWIDKERGGERQKGREGGKEIGEKREKEQKKEKGEKVYTMNRTSQENDTTKRIQTRKTPRKKNEKKTRNSRQAVQPAPASAHRQSSSLSQNTLYSSAPTHEAEGKGERGASTDPSAARCTHKTARTPFRV